ncbi:putative ribonuclease H-like domain-containing protein [Tanacetum coccineum]
MHSKASIDLYLKTFLNFYNDQSRAHDKFKNYLTDSMNYIPVSLENQTNPHAGTLEVANSAGTLQTPNANASEEEDEAVELIVMPTAVKKFGPRKSSTNSKAEEFLTELQNLKTQKNEAYSTGISEDTPGILAFRIKLDALAPNLLSEVPKNKATSPTSVNYSSGPVNTQHADQDDLDMPELTIFNKPQKGIFDEASYDDEGMVHDFNNLPTKVVQNSGAHALEEPKKISKALKDDSWVEAMQEELLQFRLQQVWILVDLPHRAKVIGTKWVYRNKRDERGVVVRNKARLVAQGHRQEEGINYDEVFAHVARIEAIRSELLHVFVDKMVILSSPNSMLSSFVFDSDDGISCAGMDNKISRKYEFSNLDEQVLRNSHRVLVDACARSPTWAEYLTKPATVHRITQFRSLLKDLLSHLGYTMGGMISSTSSHLGSVPVLKYTLYPFSEVPRKTVPSQDVASRCAYGVLAELALIRRIFIAGYGV